MLRVRAAVCTGLIVSCGLVPPLGATAGAAPGALLDYHAYSSWRRIVDVRVSRDGTRLAYAQVATEADGELIVRDPNAPRTSAEFRAPRGRGPEFSPDGRFVVYRIAAPVADVKAAEKAGKSADERPKDALGIAAVGDVANARATTVERVRSFVLARDGATLAYLLEPSPSPVPSSSPAASPTTPAPSSAPRRPLDAVTPPAPSPAPSPSPHADASAAPAPKGPGKDAPTALGIRRLGEAEAARIPNVSAYAVSADGSRVAYVVQTKADESIRVREMASGAERVIAHGNAHVVAPVLSADGASLAYLSDPDAYGENASKEKGARAPYRLMVADTTTGAVAEAFGPATAGVPARTFASDARTPEFSGDGKRLALWTANVPVPRPSSAPARVDLDFWYWRDGKLPTQLRREAQQARIGAHLALYDLSAKRFTQLGTPEAGTVALAGDARYALGVTDAPYAKLVTWDDSYYDVYRVDVTTGARMLLERKAKGRPPALSPTGRYAVAYDELRRAWYTLRLADGRKAWITDSRTVRAADEEDDHPAPPPPYGIAGWTPDDRSVLVYDRYDVWSVAPDGGTPLALTGGAGRRTQHIYRVVQPRTDERDGVFVAGRPVFAHAPYLLSFTDDRTKAEGFAALSGLQVQTPRITMRLDKAIGAPYRGRDAS